MQLNKELFGKKIICNGYLKKIPTKYVYANIRHYDKMNDYPITGDEIFLSEDEEYIEQKTMEVCNCKFKGIIVGIREVSTKNYYEQATRSIYDPDTLGYDDEEFIDGVRVEKQDFVDCYIVYYTNNKKRLVPIDMIQKIEGGQAIMEDKIEAGEYVRTTDGIIGEYYQDRHGFDFIKTDKETIGFDIEKDIVKHSKNIIDLMKVGDIVELVDVLNQEIIYIWDKEMLEAIKQDIAEGQILKSILTREEFMNRKYKV